MFKNSNKLAKRTYEALPEAEPILFIRVRTVASNSEFAVFRRDADTYLLSCSLYTPDWVFEREVNYIVEDYFLADRLMRQFSKEVL